METHVEFTLNLRDMSARSGKYPNHMGSTTSDSPIAVLGWTSGCLGLNPEQASLLRARGEAVIRCTPEQFVGFLTTRCSRGYINSFRELKVRLVQSMEQRLTIDVRPKPLGE